VELISSELDLEPLRSVPLVISTYSVVSTHKVPRSALSGQPFAAPETNGSVSDTTGNLLVTVLTAMTLTLTVFCAMFFSLCRGGSSEEEQIDGEECSVVGDHPEVQLFAVSPSVAHKMVASPLEVASITQLHAARRL